ncbi:hypothetical protein [Amycolatopsis magusensis]|uniref:hypothetical protein n=1 Tax=Amycolatopsis magusensis TaxID=882444 RepID=UPI003789E4FE
MGVLPVLELRTGHPQAPVLPLLRQTLVSIADDAEHIMIVTDADGLILWREGASEVCRRADEIGTNAMGTALATGEAVQPATCRPQWTSAVGRCRCRGRTAARRFPAAGQARHQGGTRPEALAPVPRRRLSGGHSGRS